MQHGFVPINGSVNDCIDLIELRVNDRSCAQFIMGIDQKCTRSELLRMYDIRTHLAQQKPPICLRLTSHDCDLVGYDSYDTYPAKRRRKQRRGIVRTPTMCSCPKR